MQHFTLKSDFRPNIVLGPSICLSVCWSERLRPPIWIKKEYGMKMYLRITKSEDRWRLPWVQLINLLSCRVVKSQFEFSPTNVNLWAIVIYWLVFGPDQLLGIICFFFLLYEAFLCREIFRAKPSVLSV